MAKLSQETKDAIDARVLGMTNDVLYEETLALAGGDDWDGEFTTEGQYEYTALCNELAKRLKACGFLQED